ncbi:MAG: pyridoxamine 5'-phosphate oxidase family protein [Armatimonadota bacterium]|nr:pyridoxamine 5'-phosphate oxidase family protein [Armatimonadota bacterium]
MEERDIKDRARHLMEQHPVAVFGTIDDQGFPHLRPMYTLEIGDDFTVYFATGRDLLKAKQIAANPKISLTWSAYSEDMARWSHAQIKGLATITDNEELRHRLWIDEFERYFPGGKDDPNYVILVVKPREMLFTDDHTYPPYEVGF